MAVERRTGRAHSHDGGSSVRVWGEAGITLAVTDDPPQFVRVSFGHERLAPDDSPETIKKYEKLINELNETIVAKRARKLKKLLRS